MTHAQRSQEVEAVVRRIVAEQLETIVRRVVDTHLQAGVAPAAGDLAHELLVRDALRNLAVPAALATSPLARGTGVRQRAESVRALLREAGDHAFGDSATERLLSEVFARGHLDTATTHEQAAARLHLSRATYFRRLRVATTRVCAYLAAERVADAA